MTHKEEDFVYEGDGEIRFSNVEAQILHLRVQRDQARAEVKDWRQLAGARGSMLHGLKKAARALIDTLARCNCEHGDTCYCPNSEAVMQPLEELL